MFRLRRLAQAKEETARAEAALKAAEDRGKEIDEVVITVRDVLMHNHISARVRNALRGREAS